MLVSVSGTPIYDRPPARKRSVPRADEEEIAQIKQNEQGCEPADDSQDSNYHGSLPLG
jgi:hypothetical protein